MYLNKILLKISLNIKLLVGLKKLFTIPFIIKLVKKSLIDIKFYYTLTKTICLIIYYYN